MLLVRMEMIGSTIPNALHEVIRNYQWLNVMHFLAEILSECESKLKEP